MFRFDTKLGRRDYWVRYLPSTALVLIGASMLNSMPQGTLLTILFALIYLAALLTYIVFLVATVKQRANDIGWYPVVAAFAALFLPFGTLIIGLIPPQRQ